MARLIAHNPQRAKLKASGYRGEPTGEITLTENHQSYNVKSYATATTDIPDPVLIEKEITENGTYSAQDDNADGYSVVDVDIEPTLQEKSVNPSSSAQEITPDSGYDGLSKVTVGGAPLQNKSVTPSTSAQSVQADNDYYGLGEVEVNATPLEAKTVTPTSQQQVVTPTAPNIGLSSVTVGSVPDSLKNVNLDAFFNDTLRHFYSTANTIPRYSCYKKTSLQIADIPNAVKIESSAFERCTNIVTVNLSNEITIIGQTAFNACFNLEDIVLSNSIEEIGTGAFAECTKIAITKLPKNILTIGNVAFRTCWSIPYLDMSDVSQIPSIQSATFGVTNFPFLFRDQAQLDAYAAATNWSALASRFQIKGA